MSIKGFENELARALARPDIDYLRSVTAVYCDWSARNRERRTDEWPEELDVWFADVSEDWDRSLTLVVLAMCHTDDPEILGVVAAGLLENILTSWPRPSEQLIERIVDEARRTPRFRWLLSGVWRMSMDEDQANLIARAVARVDCNRDPLPPRPWA